LIFRSKDKKSVYTRYGILENFKKPGLEKEALGKLGDLTPGRLYHNYSVGKLLKSYKNFAIINFLM